MGINRGSSSSKRLRNFSRGANVLSAGQQALRLKAIREERLKLELAHLQVQGKHIRDTCLLIFISRILTINPAFPSSSSIAVDDHSEQANGGFDYEDVDRDVDEDDLMLGGATSILDGSEKLDLSHAGGEMEEALREAIRHERR